MINGEDALLLALYILVLIEHKVERKNTEKLRLLTIGHIFRSEGWRRRRR